MVGIVDDGSYQKGLGGRIGFKRHKINGSNYGALRKGIYFNRCLLTFFYKSNIELRHPDVDFNSVNIDDISNGFADIRIFTHI